MAELSTAASLPLLPSWCLADLLSQGEGGGASVRAKEGAGEQGIRERNGSWLLAGGGGLMIWGHPFGGVKACLGTRF